MVALSQLCLNRSGYPWVTDFVLGGCGKFTWHVLYTCYRSLEVSNLRFVCGEYRNWKIEDEVFACGK